mgnify:CR=1 FL=1
MNKETEEKIIELNKNFYRITRETFSKSRNYTWVGWDKLFEYIKDKKITINNILDLACGNGRFVNVLKKHMSNFNYLGIDTDNFLIEEAFKNFGSTKTTFIKCDLLNTKDISTLDLDTKYDLIVSFGFMHHIPSPQKRIEFFNYVNQNLNDSGIFCFSVWDFPGKKYQERVNKEEIAKELNLNEAIKDSNDYILDWREGNKAFRFAKYYTESELNTLLEQSNFEKIYSFTADGRDQKSNRYFIVKKKS